MSKHWQSIPQPNSSGHRKPTRHNKCNYPQEKCHAWNKHPLAPLLAKPDHLVPCKRPYSDQVSSTSSLSPCPLLLHSHHGARGEHTNDSHSYNKIIRFSSLMSKLKALIFHVLNPYRSSPSSLSLNSIYPPQVSTLLPIFTICHHCTTTVPLPPVSKLFFKHIKVPVIPASVTRYKFHRFEKIWELLSVHAHPSLLPQVVIVQPRTQNHAGRQLWTGYKATF